jgi:hypothetical protein
MYKVSGELTTLLVVTGLYLLYAVSLMILVDPIFRYVSAGSMLPMISGLISLRMLWLASHNQAPRDPG